METYKSFFIRHFERIVVVSILLVVAVSHFWFARGAPILFFYFLPALLAGYISGKRQALLTAMFSILAVVFIAILVPDVFMPRYETPGPLFVALDLMAWGGFLILAALMTGQLYEKHDRRIQELKASYLGILEIMSKYLEKNDEGCKGHSVKVAELAAELGEALGLPKSSIDNIHAAALLHDLGRAELSGELIRRAAMLTQTDRELIDNQSSSGVELLQSVGSVLQEAVPLIRYHHDYYVEGNRDGVTLESLPLGTRVIAVADAYENITGGRPGFASRVPWVALKEIEKNAGRLYDRDVVRALQRVVARHMESEELTVSAGSGR